MSKLRRKLLVVLLLLGGLPTLVAFGSTWFFLSGPLRVSRALQQEERVSSLEQKLKRLRRAHAPLRQGMTWLVVGVLTLVSLLALWLWQVLLTSFSQTLRELRETVRASSPQDLFRGSAARLQKARSDDELQRLQEDLAHLFAHLDEGQQKEVFQEQVERWQDVARRLAHEIKNPLTPILLAVQELDTQYKDGDGRYERLLRSTREIVQEEVETLRRLVEEFSSFAKLPQVRLQLEDLNRVVRDFLDSYGWFAQQAQVEFVEGEAALWCRLDRALLKRVLFNLVQNAIEASSPQVILRTGVLPDGRRLCQIEDRGPGLPAHLQSKVFTPYFTTKQFGTGLGLAITKKIVIDHGGDIKAGANAQGGATFTIFLPAPTEEEAPETPQEKGFVG